MTHERQHEHELLASGEVCRVERCVDCGTVYLHMGAVSVRLTASAFESTCATLFAALQICGGDGVMHYLDA